MLTIVYLNSKIQVTLDNSKYTGPSLNFERLRIRVFKSPEILGLIDQFLIYNDRNYFVTTRCVFTHVLKFMVFFLNEFELNMNFCNFQILDNRGFF